MESSRSVAVCVGSLRKEAFSRRTAVTLAEVAPKSLTLDIVEIGQLPLYNEDDEHAPPASWTALRQTIRAAQEAFAARIDKIVAS